VPSSSSVLLLYQLAAPAPELGLTLRSSGLAFGQPLTSNVSPHMSQLEHSWARAWNGIGSHTHGEDVRSTLVARYEEPHRKYHTLQHLTECLSAFESVQDLPVHAAEVELALWFHDAIYDVKRSNNEERSAEWAKAELLKANAPPEVAARVHALVIATKHSATPVEPDGQILIDIDLGILGSAEPRFAEYEHQICAEYAFVPSLLFKRKRRAIPLSFLDRPRIYSTPHFHAALEEQARANLRRAVGKSAG